MSSIPDQAYIKDNSAVDQILSNLAHIPAFAFLALFWLKTFNLNGDRLFSNLLILSALVLFAVSTEFLQSYVPGRTASFMDFSLNVIGIFLGALSQKLNRRLSRFPRG